MLSLASLVVPHARLEGVRILHAAFETRDSAPAAGAQEPRSGIALRHKFTENRLVSFVTLELQAPPPKGFPESIRLFFTASFELAYAIDMTKPVLEEAIACFAKINGIYNAWPYWREYVHSAALRMGFPPVTIPLLHVEQATQLAIVGSKGETSR